MTSSNEWKALNQNDNLIKDSSVKRTGLHRATFTPTEPQGNLQANRDQEHNDSPPWQRGTARVSHSSHRTSESYADAQLLSHIANAEVRLNHFITGTAEPPMGVKLSEKNYSTQELDPVLTRNESTPAETYTSELPDLSRSLPRSKMYRPTSDSSSGVPGAVRSVIAEVRKTNEAQVQTSRRSRGPVRASMQIRRIDPWSTLKVSLLLSVALFFVWMIAVAFLYLVLGGMGVWVKLNSNVGDLLNSTNSNSGELVSSSTIFGGAILIGLANIVLMTAMGTIATFVYNLITDLVGGIEVTLADLD
ncbi:hypothetical protein MUBE_01065 [Mycobacterium uberis]|uniref:DUF3566 domain-containing protein n=1 Tax=Mycobacterium uberis TaxID=2162698 RepID=A0A3E1HLX8_9MYCO|nr:DUF3566 domain-containing protein [Mycobacterium uberis]RFD27234.1 hypothetical protein MUBE_01065 [Mycobacterium uberis]